MKAGDMTDGIFLIHIVDALQETVTFTEGVECVLFGSLNCSYER